jgi:hypothetical protein
MNKVKFALMGIVLSVVAAHADALSDSATAHLANGVVDINIVGGVIIAIAAAIAIVGYIVRVTRK